MDVILIITGFVVGAIVAWLIGMYKFKADLQRASSENEIEKDRLESTKIQLQESQETLREEREKTLELNAKLTASQSDFRHLQEKLNEQQSELENIHSKFTHEFKNLANEILEEKSKKFTDQNRANLGEILNPLKERIEKFEQRVERNSKESVEWNSALREQLNHLKELNQQVTREAENLTKALKGDSKAQGSWGEMQLEAILSKVGLEKDIHYFREKNYKNEEGKNQRLDYIIKLPDDKYLVLDSKVSLTAYSEYFESDDSLHQAKFLKRHMDSIYVHIKSLSERNYQNLYEINQPDYIMMFVANEPALSVAFREDQGLYEKALDKNIVLVSTSTLLATLRTISYIWKQDLQNKNALEIARQAGSLYDKFTSFTDDLVKVGKHLEQTQGSYKEAVKKLYDGKDNLIRKTERLKELGAKTSRNMDQRLLDRAEDDL
jgi:DNA recombination protein RmuC